MMVTSHVYRIKVEDHKLLIELHKLRKGVWRTSAKLTVVTFLIGLTCFVYFSIT